MAACHNNNDISNFITWLELLSLQLFYWVYNYWVYNYLWLLNYFYCINLETLPKLAIPTPLLPGSGSNPNGSSPYLAGYLAAVAAANGSSLNSSGSHLPMSRPPTSVSSHSAAANLMSAINRWPSPAGGIPPGFPFGGIQNPFLRPGN